MILIGRGLDLEKESGVWRVESGVKEAGEAERTKRERTERSTQRKRRFVKRKQRAEARMSKGKREPVKVRPGEREPTCAVLRVRKQPNISGDNSLRDPPVPIPNTEVKPQHADSTWLETAR